MSSRGNHCLIWSRERRRKVNPQELALSLLGEVPEGTPETWEEVNAVLTNQGVSNGFSWDMGRRDMEEAENLFEEET